MARNSKRPGDVTGRKAEELARKHADDLAARAQEITLLQAAQAEEDAKPIDLVMNTEVTPVAPGDVEVADVVQVEVPMKTFRVNTTLEQVTIGKDNHFDFEEGRSYTAPKYVYDHLEEKGLIWH